VESFSRIVSHTFFNEVCSVGLHGLSIPTNYDFPHGSAVPRLLGHSLSTDLSQFATNFALLPKKMGSFSFLITQNWATAKGLLRV
jgi:hypothetical protein